MYWVSHLRPLGDLRLVLTISYCPLGFLWLGACALPHFPKVPLPAEPIGVPVYFGATKWAFSIGGWGLHPSTWLMGKSEALVCTSSSPEVLVEGRAHMVAPPLSRNLQIVVSPTWQSLIFLFWFLFPKMFAVQQNWKLSKYTKLLYSQQHLVFPKSYSVLWLELFRLLHCKTGFLVEDLWAKPKL